MKNFILVFVFIFSLLSSCISNETTTYYLIRHAEKDRTDITNNNPDLNENGLKRAENWAKYFENIDLDAIYSTKYNRTMQTAIPTSVSKKLDILNYDPRKMNYTIFQQNTKGKTILIVGHSNTTPAFVNTLLGEKKYEYLRDNDNASLYIVTIIGDKKTSSIEKVGK